MYIFDTSPISTLFRNFYPEVFTSLWQRFDALVDHGEVLSVREVLRELEDGPVVEAFEWANSKRQLFRIPSADEANFLKEIYSNRHFQLSVERKKILNGGRNADGFVIASAMVNGASVVTMEKHKDNSVKIPTICNHFGIECMTLAEFMQREGWSF